MSARLAHEKSGDADTQPGYDEPEEERSRTQPSLRGDEPGEQRGQRDRAIAGRFVESHRQAAALGTDQVDFHDHRRRPGEALVDAEEEVGDDDPAP